MSGPHSLVKSIPHGRARARGLAVWGRLCLIVSLWQAPVPLIHSHGSDIDEALSPSAAVAHLNEQHSGVRVNSHVDFGWHVHFVLLADPVADEPYDEDGQPDRAPFYDPFVTCQAEGCPTSALAFEWQVPACGNAHAQRGTRPAPVVSSTTPTQFLGTYLDAVPLRTLLRVARC